MPQEAEAGKRLARDMRRIREAHNLTLDDLHEETKIPLGLIQAFEDTGLFDHPQFNRVYLRSFMRTYAQVVGVDAEVALEALEEALAGRYAGSLAAEYLDEPDRTQAPPEAGRTEDEAVDEERAAPDQDRAEATPSGAADRPPRERLGEEREPPIVSTTGESASGADGSGYEEVEEEADEDWASQSPPPGKRSGAAIAAATSRERRTRPPRSRTDRSGMDRRWVIGGAMIIVVAVVAWIMISMLGGDAEPEATEPMAAADTAQIEDTTAAQPAPAQAMDLPAIGDTIDVHIIASQDKVDPIRVTVDDDLRRPYWIDQGDSMAFQPTDRIVIEELLENISLSVEGIDYPTDRRDAQNRIVITRDSVENYFASLQQGQ